MASSVIKNISPKHILSKSGITATTPYAIDFNATPFVSKNAYLVYGGQAYQQNSCRYLAIVFAYNQASVLLEIHKDSNITSSMSNGVLSISIADKQTNIGITCIGKFT